jgi:hypothetical protein
MTNKEVGIYLIDKRKFKNKSNDNIISEIIGNTKRKYNMLEIENNKIDNYNIKLYNYISYSQDLWSTFFNCKTNDKELIKKDSISNNFIAFIKKIIFFA